LQQQQQQQQQQQPAAQAQPATGGSQPSSEEKQLRESRPRDQKIIKMADQIFDERPDTVLSNLDLKFAADTTESTFDFHEQTGQILGGTGQQTGTLEEDVKSSLMQTISAVAHDRDSNRYSNEILARLHVLEQLLTRHHARRSV